jgi:hypothetical protein
MYWFLIERLAEAGGYLPTEMIPIYAQQMDVEEREVHNLVNDFKLFEFAENQFFSERLLRHLEMREQDKNNKSKAGKKSAETRLQNSASTEIQQTFNTCSTPVDFCLRFAALAIPALALALVLARYLAISLSQRS